MKLRATVTLAMVSIILGALLVSAQQAGSPGLLTPDEVKKALPESVFFRGEKAPVQLRNAAGARFADGKLLLITLVDNSGYSTAIQEKYQGYLINEVKLTIGDRDLPPGAYGCGVVNGKFLVMDVAANEVFSVDAPPDAQLKRPRPLMLSADGDGYQLHLGRNMVRIAAAR